MNTDQGVSNHVDTRPEVYSSISLCSGYGGIEQRTDAIPNAIPQDVMVVNPNWDATIESSYRSTVQDIQRKVAA